ncbi:CBU_0592 family membrane protein [Streptosporangium fragile]|uniref:CBU_0592 family membrane protein n=1 Tax=Streptosporangium fragile TaxID=46186 RepID=UPI0031EE93BE
MSVLVNLLGWAGAAAMLYGYAMVSASRMAGDGMTYQAINLVGAAALMVNTAYHAAWPSAVLNVVWGAVGLASVTRLLSARLGEKGARIP